MIINADPMLQVHMDMELTRVDLLPSCVALTLYQYEAFRHEGLCNTDPSLLPIC